MGRGGVLGARHDVPARRKMPGGPGVRRKRTPLRPLRGPSFRGPSQQGDRQWSLLPLRRPSGGHSRRPKRGEGRRSAHGSVPSLGETPTEEPSPRARQWFQPGATSARSSSADGRLRRGHAQSNSGRTGALVKQTTSNHSSPF